MKSLMSFISVLVAIVGCQIGTSPPVEKEVVKPKVPTQVVQPSPKVVKPAEKSVLVVDNSAVGPTPVVNEVVEVEKDNAIIAPEVKKPEPKVVEPKPEVEPEPAVEPEPEPSPKVEVSKVCTCGDNCKCDNGKPCGGKCSCKNCKCKPLVEGPPPKPVVEVAQPKPVPPAPTTTAYREPAIPAGYIRTYFWQNGTKWYRDIPRPVMATTNNGCANGGCSTTVKKKSSYSVDNHEGQHAHKCGSCGHVFWHRGGSHMCPNCGQGPWYVIYAGSSSSSGSGRRILRWR